MSALCVWRVSKFTKLEVHPIIILKSKLCSGRDCKKLKRFGCLLLLLFCATSRFPSCVCVRAFSRVFRWVWVCRHRVGVFICAGWMWVCRHRVGVFLCAGWVWMYRHRVGVFLCAGWVWMYIHRVGIFLCAGCVFLFVGFVQYEKMAQTTPCVEIFTNVKMLDRYSS